MHSDPKAFIDLNRGRFLEELFELLRIPSVSTDSEHTNDIIRAAEFLKKNLLEAGAEKAEIIPTQGHPIIYADKIINPAFPTVLVYGHYDVQPADPLELWESPPFDPVIRNDKIYARGACDDKGQVMLQVKAFEVMVKNNSLPCNVKFMIEGEEEIGSESLEWFVKGNKKKLASDIILISDTDLFGRDIPTITTSLRGIAYLEVEVTGPNRDLHSGSYGGGVANPVNVLCRMIASLKDENNRVTIPGFYDEVVEYDTETRAAINRAPFDLNLYKKDLGINDIEGETGYSTLERVGIRPSFDVNGIWGGYTGEGAKTVLPCKATAKISMRLVPNQESQDITERFTRYIKSLAPKTIKVKVTDLHGGEPAITPTDSIGYRAAAAAFREGWGKDPIPMMEGGSIPIVAMFKRELGVDSLLLGFGLAEDAIHSPNESFGLFNFFKGMETVILFYKHFAQMTKKPKG